MVAHEVQPDQGLEVHALVITKDRIKEENQVAREEYQMIADPQVPASPTSAPLVISNEAGKYSTLAPL